MSLSFAVVVCTFDFKLVNDLAAAIESVRKQSYSGHVAIVVCVDGNERLSQMLCQKYKGVGQITVVSTGKEEPYGLVCARSVAIEYCSEDVISFLDDDATADESWIAKTAESFSKYDCMLVTGKIIPDWLSAPPSWLTPAFYWLIGATGTLEKDEESVVRSGFGSNLSCMRDALLKVDLRKTPLGKRGSSLLQAEDTELGIRIRRAFGKEAIYNPKAIVFHKVKHEKLAISYLIRRAYYQGISKAILYVLNGRDPKVLAPEYSYLRLVFHETANIMKGLLSGHGIGRSIKTLLFNTSITMLVGIGFVATILYRKSQIPSRMRFGDQ